MKKITLFFALMCSVSLFSTRYLVEGTTGTNTWRAAGAGEVNVITSDFRGWYYTTFPAGYTYNAADEIWLAGGTYTLGYSFGTRKVSVYGGFSGTETSISQRSKVSVGKAWEFSSPTVLDGNNAIPQGFTTLSTPTTPTTFIDGVTITRCQITNVTASVFGVGAYLSQGWIMQNCIVSNNTYNNTAATNSFDGNGGGIYLTGGQVIDSYIAGNQLIKGNGRNTIGGGIAFAYTSEAALNTISGCTIENNTCTTYGGGIEIINGTGGTIENCIVKGNTCSDRGAGLGYTNIIGGAGTSTLSIKNCQFIENTSATYGGGVALNFGTAATTIFENNSIIGNTGVNAGGMYIGGGKFSPIKNCIFRDNKCTNASNGGYSAGALFCNVAGVILQNCIFTNNSSVANTNTNSAVELVQPTIKMYNCTFANNSDPGAAGCTVNSYSQSQTHTNNVFWGNVAGANISNASNVISTYNATTSDKNTTGIATGGGNVGNITTLTTSPNNTFVSPTIFTGVPTDALTKAASAVANWSMVISSPAVDTGVDLTTSGVITDIIGNARPIGTAYDMGAYERSSLPTGINPVHSTLICYSTANGIEVSGLTNGEIVTVYGVTGNLIYNQKAFNSSISISVPQGIYLVRTTDKVNKLIVR